MALTLHASQGEPFTVDDEDAPLVKRFEWRLVTCKTKGGKQNRDLVTLALPRFGSKSLRLRALIMGTHPQAGMLAYVINGDSLCMEKSNLAWMNAITLRHRTAAVKNVHGFRGIVLPPACRRWTVRNLNQKGSCNLHNTAEEAALDYDRIARERYGCCARVNFPLPDDPVPEGIHFPPFNGHLSVGRQKYV